MWEMCGRWYDNHVVFSPLPGHMLVVADVREEPGGGGGSDLLTDGFFSFGYWFLQRKGRGSWEVSPGMEYAPKRVCQNRKTKSEGFGDDTDQSPLRTSTLHLHTVMSCLCTSSNVHLWIASRLAMYVPKAQLITKADTLNNRVGIKGE